MRGSTPDAHATLASVRIVGVDARNHRPMPASMHIAFPMSRHLGGG
jgi:hypothetical protein